MIVTLIVAIGNSAYSAIVVDRRLTISGVPLTDEANKLTFLCCDDARVAIAFTGLAEINGIRTDIQLMLAIKDIVASAYDITGTVLGLIDRLNSLWKNHRLKGEKLIFIVTGFVYWEEVPQQVCMWIGNDGDPQRATFSLRQKTIQEPEVLLESIGTTSGLDDEAVSRLRELLVRRRPAAEAVTKAVSIIQRAAERSSELVGLQCNSAVISSSPDRIMSGTYHSAFRTGVAYLPNIAFPRGAQFMNGKSSVSEAFLAGPSIRKNDDCWCNSGRKFKACHMKIMGTVSARSGGFGSPLFPTQSIEFEKGYPSGKRFVVASRFD